MEDISNIEERAFRVSISETFKLSVDSTFTAQSSDAALSLVQRRATAKDLARSRAANHGFDKKNTQAAAARREARRRRPHGGTVATNGPRSAPPTAFCTF
jgi:hypothetical protein